MRARPGLPTLALLLLAAACRSAYYGALEQVGIEKRHILADRVEDGREEQRAAQEQFQTALERFQALTGYDGGNLEDTYESLSDELERSEQRADAVRARIDSIDEVANDLFAEWAGEIDAISSPALRRSSSERLRETQASYAKLIAAMRRAESRMDPVLTAFRDQVLYLKHNLNARAIASLEGEVHAIESDVALLVQEMDAAIREADAFLAGFEG